MSNNAPDRTEKPLTAGYSNEPLTYEQEIHALLYAGRTAIRDLKLIFEHELKTPGALTPDERKIQKQCVANFDGTLARIDAAIPLAGKRRSGSSLESPALAARDTARLDELEKLVRARRAPRFMVWGDDCVEMDLYPNGKATDNRFAGNDVRSAIDAAYSVRESLSPDSPSPALSGPEETKTLPEDFIRLLDIYITTNKRFCEMSRSDEVLWPEVYADSSQAWDALKRYLLPVFNSYSQSSAPSPSAPKGGTTLCDRCGNHEFEGGDGDRCKACGVGRYFVAAPRSAGLIRSLAAKLRASSPPEEPKEPTPCDDLSPFMVPCTLDLGHEGLHKSAGSVWKGEPSTPPTHKHECQHGHPHDGRCECVCGYIAWPASKSPGGIAEEWHAGPPEGRTDATDKRVQQVRWDLATYDSGDPDPLQHNAADHVRTLLSVIDQSRSGLSPKPTET